MDKDIIEIKSNIENALSVFLEQLDEVGVDVECVDVQLQYSDGFILLELNC